MDWQNEYKEAYKHYRALGERHIDEVVASWSDAAFPFGLWDALHQDGLLSAMVGEGQEARDMGYLAAAIEGLTYGTLGGGVAISIVAHAVLTVSTIKNFANPEIRDHYLRLLTEGKGIAAFAVTESHGGSDALHPRCTLAKAAGGGYVLSGTKWHITNAPFASIIVCFGRNEATNEFVALLVDPKWPGVEIPRQLNPMGARNSPVASIHFRSVPVPESHILGVGSLGLKILAEAFVAERILTAFPCLGAMDYLIAKVLSYTSSREIFGRPIGDYQFIQHRLTNMKFGLDSARALAHGALRGLLAGQDVSLEASLVKMHATRSFYDASSNAIQIFGSYGIQKEEHLTMVLLDALATTIAGGTEEVHRTVIYQQMMLRHRREQRKALAVPVDQHEEAVLSE